MQLTKETATATITALGELTLRLELEAAAFAQIHSRDGELLAEERLEQAEDMRRLAAGIAKGMVE